MKAGGLIFLFLIGMAIAFGLILGDAEIMKPYTGPKVAARMDVEMQQAAVDQQQAREQRKALADEELRHAQERHRLEEAQAREALRHTEAMNRQREAAQRQHDEAIRLMIGEIVPILALTFAVACVLAVGAFAFLCLYRSIAYIQGEQTQRQRAAQAALLHDQQLAHAQALADGLLAMRNQMHPMPPAGNTSVVEGGIVSAQPRGQLRPRSRLIAAGRSD